MSAHERSEVPANPDDELIPISERAKTAAMRREVGRAARAAWTALQRTLASFARAKSEATDRLMIETGHACDAALSELDRLEQALRSLRSEISAGQRASASSDQVEPARHSFLDALGRRLSGPPT